VPGDALDRAALEALDGLLRALTLERLADDRFRACNEPGRFGRIFGGQMIGQALLAACATVTDKPPHSLHVYFSTTGDLDHPVEMAVERVRDGRSMATRRVTMTQGERTLLIAMASFHDNADRPTLAPPPPPSQPPELLPLLQDWAEKAPPDLPNPRVWIDTPPPLEMRIGEPTYFLGGSSADGPRSHWMRLPRNVGDDPALHSVLLAYASDYLLLDMAYRSHPDRAPVTSFAAFSLDHTIWLHRPVQFDQWHIHTQEMLSMSGHRALIKGTIHDIAGQLVATTAQEVLVRDNS
jgi:acyl-CoA thioesterase-2